MQIFYTPEISGNIAVFSRDESGHCLRVLRMHRGDRIFFTDGKGNMYEGIIEKDDPDAMRVSITGRKSNAHLKSYRLHVAISTLKNVNRLEWFIEKAVEIGIDEITPLLCVRTEKKRIRRERLEGLILSAMKQSVKTTLPRLNEPAFFGDFLGKPSAKRKLIACCDDGFDRQAINTAVSGHNDIVILIGPEGDFTAEEVRQAIRAGYMPVHLGPSRLRTETAGVAACCSVYLANI
jgi:16S rRNA (uracil1498-N3)-methyltransferase